MGKLYLYYKHNGSNLGDKLKVKIDDNITLEIPRDEIYEQELSNGQHNIKAYYPGWSEDQLVGYIDETIEVTDATFYTYKNPQTMYGKAKFIKFNCNSPDKFMQMAKRNKTFSTIMYILLLIIFIIAFVLDKCI